MKLFIILLIALFVIFIINIVFGYIHKFNARKKKIKKNTISKRLLSFFLHLNIVKEIIVNSIFNFFTKIRLISFCVYKYVSYNKYKYTQISKNEEIDESLINKENYEIKTIYFIRHSESIWNNTFNKKVTIKTFMNIFLIIFYELIFLFSRKSVLIDSPLSTNGIIQSLELSNFLQEKGDKNGSEKCVVPINPLENSDENTKKYENSLEMIKLQRCNNNINKNNVSESNNDMKKMEDINNLNNENDHYDPEKIINFSVKEHIDVLNNLKYKSVLLCSDLRRTISSCFISFYNRINKFNESIYILNSLQEVSRNPDCVPLLKFYNIYVTTDVENFLHKDVEKLFKKNIKVSNDSSENYFLDTLKYIFNNENNIFIIFGHSLWFLMFFNSFLKIPHKAKTHKMENSSIVVFNIMKFTYGDKEYYEIEKNSIRVIYKGFKEKGNFKL